MNADGSGVRGITDVDIYWVEGAAWSSDGSRIAFTGSLISGDGEPSTWDVFTVRPDGSGLVNVTQTPASEDDEFGPTWSPDGSRLAFSRTHDNGSVVVVRDVASGTETTITEGHVDGGVAWAPDGTAIAFNRSPLEGGGFDVWLVRPDGSNLVRLTRDGGFNAAWQPVPTGQSAAPDPDSVDIGLGVAMCDVEVLDGIDWYGDGTSGAAWTGARATPDGRCPEENAGEYIVAADLDGDGEAEPGGMGFLSSCLFCHPYATTDLDADGVLELVVLEEGSSTPSYSLYEVSVPTSERSPGIYNLFVAPPGHPEARIRPGEPLRILTGGDEGFAGWVGCDGRGGELILQITWRDHPVEGDIQEVHETDLALQHGIFEVVASRDYELPVGAPVPRASDEPACGVDWQI
jgi:hypothetical protein